MGGGKVGGTLALLSEADLLIMAEHAHSTLYHGCSNSNNDSTMNKHYTLHSYAPETHTFKCSQKTASIHKFGHPGYVSIRI